MDTHAGLPSYNEAMNAPSAPPAEQSLLHQHQNAAPYPPFSPQQQSVYPPMMQQPVFQQPMVQQSLIQNPMMYNQFQQQPQRTVIIVNQHIQYGENPVSMHCYHCNNAILTKTSFENNVINHVFAGILCFMGLWCGCCCLPYCIDSIKDVKHQCPKCNTFLGLYRRGRRF